MAGEEIILSVKEQIYSVALISVWSIFVLINLIIAWICKGKSESWGKFFGIWFLTALLTGIFVGFFVMMPEQILGLINDIKTFFGM